MKFKFDYGLHKADKVGRTYVIFEEVNRFIILLQDGLTAWLIRLLYEVLYLFAGVGENLRAVVFEDALELLFEHRSHLLALL